MQRPNVILNIFSSIDGKITTAPGRNVTEWSAAGIDGNAHDITHRLYDELGCDGLVSGSETLMVFGNHWVESDQPIYEPKKSKAYIVFDGRGRIDWSQTDGLIVVTREDVASEYIEQLTQKGISYIQAGSGGQIDLMLALEKLYDQGFTKLGLTGGGGINGAFLRHGLIDEVSLVLAPLAVGGKLTPSVFDCEELKDLNGITELKLIDTKPVGKDAVLVHYNVKR